MKTEANPVWIRGPQLRRRWGLPVSTFYNHLKNGDIPKPEYPFGPHTPHWPMTAVLAHEAAANKGLKARQAVAA